MIRKAIFAFVLFSVLMIFGWRLVLHFQRQPNYYEQFDAFVERYNKNYNSLEESDRRMLYFVRNCNYVRAFNARKKGFKIAINEFSDLRFDEFRRFYLIVPIANSVNSELAIDLKNLNPKRKRWQSARAIPRQSHCGSSWAIACAAAIDGRTANAHSAQELLDCSAAQGNRGCEGGLPAQAFQYITERGIAFVGGYPYFGIARQCAVPPSAARTRIVGYETVVSGTQRELIALLTRSPVAVLFEVRKDFVFYRSGVYTADDDCGASLNHALLLVGYESSNGGFFIARNSWGGDWGENGFARIAFGKSEGGVCGIASEFGAIPTFNATKR